MAESEQFEAGVQLLVEGNDQRNFLEAIRRHLSLDNLQIWSYGGGQDLREFLKGFVRIDGFDTVQSLGVVRDAEENAENSFRSVQGSLRDVGLTVPTPRIAQRHRADCERIDIARQWQARDA